MVEVLITSCQVSLKPKNGPLAAHSTTAPQAARNATGRPVHTASLRAKSEKRNRAIAPCFLCFMRKLSMVSWLE